MKRFLCATGVLLGAAAILVSALLAYYFGVTKGVRLDPAKLTLETGQIRLFDASGAEIPTSAGSGDVPFSEFPSYLPNAFVAVEDKRFYTHKGFDPRGIARAALKNLSTLSFREGASTISQQLIKNTHLSSEKTFNRKLKEFRLTRALEKNYSKQEILELYLNSIYFGHSAFGIGEAASFYFAKQPSALTPAESALLAALVKSPNRYSPFKDPEKCRGRRNFVLKLMREQGYLGEAEYASALTEPLPETPNPIGNGNFYLSLVLGELTERFEGAGTGNLRSLEVDTAYDPLLQKKLEELSADSDLIALVRDNGTDTVKALYTTAGLPPRLPASTVKPLLVYAPAVEENLISPATPILDEKTNFSGYAPDDAGGASGKYMSVRHALSRSVNIPAVKILNALGLERGVSYLKRLGLDVAPEDSSLALALGGMREGFPLDRLADGYAALANGGGYAPSGTILRVRRGDKVLYERSPKREKVFSEDTAFLVTDMLTTAAKEGTARKLRSLPFAVAAKTGTNEGRKGNLDAYTIAYTTEDVVAVWLGNADNSPVNATGGGLPANFVKDILSYLYRNHTPANFLPPADVERIAYDKDEYEKNHKIVRSDPLTPLYDPSDFFRKSNLPEESCTRYTHPVIQTPTVSLENGSVCIVLCQAEYYDYVVKRENRGRIATIYSGPYRERILDNSVTAGESYVYTVIPYYKGREGEPAVLPSVHIREGGSIPDDWWESQSSSLSRAATASLTNLSTSSLRSSLST